MTEEEEEEEEEEERVNCVCGESWPTAATPLWGTPTAAIG